MKSVIIRTRNCHRKFFKNFKNFLPENCKKNQVNQTTTIHIVIEEELACSLKILLNFYLILFSKFVPKMLKKSNLWKQKANNYRCFIHILYFIVSAAYHSTLHKKWSFPWRICSENVTKSARNCGFGHIYWRSPYFTFCAVLYYMSQIWFGLERSSPFSF